MEEKYEVLPKAFWPPKSLDLNPLDYSGLVASGVQGLPIRHGNVKGLKATVDKQWDSMSECYVANVCTAFWRRVKTEGGHIHR
ncbi:Putative transposable element [Caligus rogercresseyi]|uniref:Transposable element n=1 Tax=Caligus rogercresseyi TaxID=217165 RepID=A0A7T8KIP7_CALRO|nr:Putative transposable element [Caligus rogercresseyi]